MSTERVCITVRQLQCCIAALLHAPEGVGELCEEEAFSKFVAGITRVAVDHAPTCLLDRSLGEVISDTDPASSLLYSDDDAFLSLAECVAEHCGGSVEPMNIGERPGHPCIEVSPNDSLPDPDDILSSGAWSYAHQQPRTLQSRS